MEDADGPSQAPGTQRSGKKLKTPASATLCHGGLWRLKTGHAGLKTGRSAEKRCSSSLLEEVWPKT